MIVWLLIHMVLFFVFPIGLVVSIPLHILMGNDGIKERKRKNDILKQEVAELKEKIKQQKEEKRELISKLDEICENECLFDDNGDYDINQALELIISVYDKNIALNIKNLLYVLENYKKEDVASKFEII